MTPKALKKLVKRGFIERACETAMECAVRINSRCAQVSSVYSTLPTTTKKLVKKGFKEKTRVSVSNKLWAGPYLIHLPPK